MSTPNPLDEITDLSRSNRMRALLHALSLKVEREVWLPARWVRVEQICGFCWRTIAVAKPGATTGTRGTKAYFESTRRTWECLHCHAERVRVEVARDDDQRHEAAALLERRATEEQGIEVAA